MKPPAIEGLPCFARKVVGAERDQPSVGGHYGDAAVTQPFDIEIPDILEGHTGDGKSVVPASLQKGIEVDDITV